jgi:hypothetical protein
MYLLQEVRVHEGESMVCDITEEQCQDTLNKRNMNGTVILTEK